MLLHCMRIAAGWSEDIWQMMEIRGIQCYMRLVCTDCVAFLIYVILESVLPVAHISFPRLLVLSTVNTMGALIMRMSYRYAYKCSNLETFFR